jgi:glycosyltransferase involved in cell wall biosynthesis
VIIGYLGNLFRSKGIEELVDSAFAVLDRGFDIEMRLAGAWWEKDENFRSEILGRIRRHPGGDRIIFVGVLTGERKVNFLEEIDVLVVPGGYPMEGMPLVILEAMERGKAVVGAMDTGAISDVIEDGKTGLLVPARSVPALADAISMLAGDSVLRTRMGLEGRRIFQTRYTLRRHIEDLVALLRDMVAES